MSVVRLKSGGYLSSQRLTVSTFGVKELNFCVRNGNRWILFAIVTAIVIYSAFTVHIRLYLSHAGIRRSRFFMADLLSSCNLALHLIRYEKLLTQQSDRFSKRFWERWAKLYRPYSENAFAERFGKDALCCGFVLCLHGYEKINNYIANLRKSFFHIAFLIL